MTDEEKKKVEDLVNTKIKEAILVTYEDLPLEEAEKKGAIGLFEEKYGDKVRVYKIGDFSLEFCGGPHVKNTSELGEFKISKEEAVSAGTSLVRCRRHRQRCLLGRRAAHPAVRARDLRL